MNQLDPITFPLQAGRLIEASAGTGKTFTISLLYLRLVLGHRHPEHRDARPLTPPEILVSTFTEAAVEELRDRIRTRLQQAAWLFAGTLTPKDVDEPLRRLHAEFDPDERARGGFRLQRAAEWMDEAAIFTIHGFCQRMLREHAFHSRALFEQELMTDLDPVVGEAIRDFWRTHGYPLAQDDARLARQFARIVPAPGALKDRIRDLIRRDGSPVADGDVLANHSNELPEPATLLERLAAEQDQVDKAEKAARAAWREDPATLHEQWHAVRAGLSKKSYPDAKQENDFAAWLAQIDAWADGQTPLSEKVRGNLAWPKTNKGTKSPEHPALDAIRGWHEQAERVEEEAEQVRPAIEAFAALWIRERIATLLASRRAMGFDDMLIQMRDAVDAQRNPNADGMTAAIRAQYPVALIDEFQDTDPLQYAIFSAIYPLDQRPAGDEHAIVLIGDPKQAIYSFRGADIHSYLTARRATEGRHASLPRNFRSTEAMVGAVNHLCTVADRHPQGAFRFPADGEANPVPFHPVDAQGRTTRLVDDDLDGELPALTAWTTPPGETWNATSYVDELAVRAAGEIAAMLNAGQAGRCGFENAEGERVGIQPRDIAVLVRTGTQGRAMRQALSDFGVPAVYLSEKASVFESAEAADMLVWLDALATPARSDRIRQAVATASLALPLDELEALLLDEVAFDEICRRFHDWHRAWRGQGVLAAIMGLMHHFSVPARLLDGPERESRRGERRLTNLLHLAEWLQETDHDVDGETALIHRLHLAMTEGAGQQEIRLEQDSEMVRIVTIHGSKGLQYPVVFLPFAALIGRDESSAAKANGKSSGASEPTRRHRHGQNVWDMRPDQAARDRAERESIAEEIRLLYVALTRAEFACRLGAGPVAIGTKEPNPGKTAFGQFLGFAPGEKASNEAIAAALDEWAAHPAVSIAPVPERRDPATHRFVPPAPPALHGPRHPGFGPFEPWWISSFSALTASTGHVTLPAPEEAREEVRMESQAEETAARAGGGALPDEEPMTPEGIHALPRGAKIGTLLHDLIEAIAKEGFDRHVGRPERVRRLMERSAHPGLRELDEAQREVVARSLDTLLAARWELPDGAPPMALPELTRHQAEMEFWLAVETADTARLDALVREHVAPDRPRPALSGQAINGMLKGFIDLTVEHDGRYYLIDWKSNWLGPNADAYGPEALEEAMLEHRYDLQFVLYLVALHRHLADRLEGYDYDRHIGGAVYVFLRGIRAAEGALADNAGIYACRPSRELIEAIDALFAGNVTGKAEGAA
ncbi:MAG: exodeoxyribonuclease V subunit beta [Pseudomonadota bacterium]